MTLNEIKSVLFDAFFHEKKVKVVRTCFGDEEVCIGFIESISRKERPKADKNKELCFSVIADSEWWRNGTLGSLSPWISQVSIEVVE